MSYEGDDAFLLPVPRGGGDVHHRRSRGHVHRLIQLLDLGGVVLDDLVGGALVGIEEGLFTHQRHEQGLFDVPKHEQIGAPNRGRLLERASCTSEGRTLHTRTDRVDGQPVELLHDGESAPVSQAHTFEDRQIGLRFEMRHRERAGALLRLHALQALEALVGDAEQPERAGLFPVEGQEVYLPAVLLEGQLEHLSFGGAEDLGLADLHTRDVRTTAGPDVLDLAGVLPGDHSLEDRDPRDISGRELRDLEVGEAMAGEQVVQLAHVVACSRNRARKHEQLLATVEHLRHGLLRRVGGDPGEIGLLLLTPDELGDLGQGQEDTETEERTGLEGHCHFPLCQAPRYCRLICRRTIRRPCKSLLERYSDHLDDSQKGSKTAFLQIAQEIKERDTIAQKWPFVKT